jgi:ferredoxin
MAARPDVAGARTARASTGAGATRLRLDPSVCDGVGICAHLAPDLVAVDSWGYPVLTDRPLSSPSQLRRASAVVRACPRRALFLDA